MPSEQNEPWKTFRSPLVVKPVSGVISSLLNFRLRLRELGGRWRVKSKFIAEKEKSHQPSSKEKGAWPYRVTSCWDWSISSWKTEIASCPHQLKEKRKREKDLVFPKPSKPNIKKLEKKNLSIKEKNGVKPRSLTSRVSFTRISNHDSHLRI